VNRIGINIIFLSIFLFPFLLNAENNFDRGKNFFEQNNFNKAVEEFNLELKKTSSPNIPVTLYYLGRSFEKKGDSEKAIIVFKKLIDDYPDNYLSQHAYNRIKLINPKQAEDKKRALVTQLPNNKKSENIVNSKVNLSSSKKISNAAVIEVKNKPLKKNDKSESLIKYDYSYSDVLKDKNANEKIKVEEQIKKQINDAYSLNEKSLIFEYKKNKTISDFQEKPEHSSNIISSKTISEKSDNILKKELNESNKLKSDSSSSEIAFSINSGNSTVLEKKNISNSENKFYKTAKIETEKIVEGESTEKFYDKALEKFNRQLYIDSLFDFKQYISKGQNSAKLEYSYYKIGEINHILGYFNDALSAYLLYSSKFEKSKNLYKAFFNIANIYYEAFGLLLPAKQYYLLTLEKTNDLTVIEKIKIPLSEIENLIKQNKIEELKQAEKIPLSEKIGDEKKLLQTANIKNVDEKNISIERQPIENSNKMTASVSDFKQIEPSLQKSKEINLSQILENKKDVNEYIAEGFKYKNLGMYEESIKNYKYAIGAYPAHPVAYNNLAYLYAELGVNLDEALTFVQTAISIDKTQVGLYFDTLGWIYYKKNDFNKAREYLEKSVFFNPSAVRKYHLGLCYKQLNLNERALVEFQNAQIMQPTGKFGDTLKNEIYSLQQ